MLDIPFKLLIVSSDIINSFINAPREGFLSIGKNNLLKKKFRHKCSLLCFIHIWKLFLK
jgi:hypothetical protein